MEAATRDAPPCARGACLCGAIRFEIPLPPRWCAHCHCSRCRRAHGAGYVTWVGVDADRFRVVEGAALLTRYASSPEATRSFCSRCGSSLFFESSRWAGEVHVALALLIDPIGLAPQAHAFFDDRADWVELGDPLPRLGGPTGTAPLG